MNGEKAGDRRVHGPVDHLVVEHRMAAVVAGPLEPEVLRPLAIAALRGDREPALTLSRAVIPYLQRTQMVASLVPYVALLHAQVDVAARLRRLPGVDGFGGVLEQIE